MKKLILILYKLKIQQDIFKNPCFYIYNIVIPLFLPFVIIIICGPEKLIGIRELGMIVSQISLYNVIMLSTNLGVLYSRASEDDKSASEELNKVFSILLLVSSAFSLILSYNRFPINNYSTPIVFAYPEFLLTSAALFFVYCTICLLSNNPNFTFVRETDTGALSQERQIKGEVLERKILGEDTNE